MFIYPSFWLGQSQVIVQGVLNSLTCIHSSIQYKGQEYIFLNLITPSFVTHQNQYIFKISFIYTGFILAATNSFF